MLAEKRLKSYRAATAIPLDELRFDYGVGG